MEEKELSPQLKKNLLDIHYAKYLQYFTTSLIIVFTYFIGLAIALLTGQVDLANIRQIAFLFSVSVTFLSIMAIILIKFKIHMRNIVAEMKQLRL